jgi:hypothetical protein
VRGWARYPISTQSRPYGADGDGGTGSRIS